MKNLKLASAVGLLIAAAAASAAVTFDAATGTGFVGKGDVQLAFGWNNSQLQRNASGVTFIYSVTDKYSAVCGWVTGEGTRGARTHDVPHTRSVGIIGAVAYDARVKNQITGFILRGYQGTVTTIGTLPVQGGACPGNPGTDGVWVSVTKLESESTDGLSATYSGVSVPLPITPPVVTVTP